METMSVTIFFSSARQDSALQERLESHLSPLKQQGMIVCWDQSLV